MEKAKYIWMDGKLVNWDDAKVHVLTHTLHYGNGAIEGTKAYKTHDGKCAIFKLQEHTQRLQRSIKMMRFVSDYSDDFLKQIEENKIDVVSVCSSDDTHFVITKNILKNKFGCCSRHCSPPKAGHRSQCFHALN